MELEFDVTLTAKDLYRFNMRNAYTSMQGILSIICAALVVFVFIWKFDKLTVMYMILFIILAVTFVLYIPITLLLRSKQVYAGNEVLRSPLTYVFDDDGVLIETEVSGEESVFLPYEDVYRACRTRSYILIYTNRISAYIIPRGADYESNLISIIASHVDDIKKRGIK